MNPTQQTLEVIAAIRAISERHRAHLADDGKESFFEKLGYFNDRGVITAAIKDIGLVPSELALLTPDQYPEIATSVSVILNSWGVNHRRSEITTEVIRDIIDSIPVFKEAINRWNIIASMPPTAELVE